MQDPCVVFLESETLLGYIIIVENNSAVSQVSHAVQWAVSHILQDTIEISDLSVTNKLSFSNWFVRRL